MGTNTSNRNERDDFRIETKEAELALSKFYFENDRLRFSDNLSKLFSNLYQNENIKVIGEDEFNLIHQNYTAICHDTWGMLTLASRIQDLEIIFNSDDLTDARFRNYLSLDLELLHYQLRSIFDYSNRIIHLLVSHPKWKDSFNSLLGVNEDKRALLNTTLIAFIDKYKTPNSFFYNIRQFRNNIDHLGSSNYIFLEKDNKEIYFSLSHLKPRKYKYPSVRPNLKDYFCWVLIKYIEFRNYLAKVILSMVDIEIDPAQDQGTYIQDDALVKWILERHAPSFVMNKKTY